MLHLLVDSALVQFFIVIFNPPEFVRICLERFIRFKHSNLVTFYSGCLIDFT